MDPLAVTSAIVTFLQIANQIKQSVEKVGQTRRRLLYLTEDVLQGISDLEVFCSTHAEDLVHLKELDAALDKLKFQLTYVLHRCRQYCDMPRDGYVSRLKANIKFWRKADDIEADVLRLKELIQSSLSRFNSLTSARLELAARHLRLASARTEERLVFAESMHRLQIQRLDDLFGDMVDGKQSDCITFSTLNFNHPDEVDRQYIRFQVQRLLSCHTSLGPLLLGEELGDNDHSLQAMFALSLGTASTQEVISHTWKVLHLLETINSHARKGGEYIHSLILLGDYLIRIDCSDSALLILDSTRQLITSCKDTPCAESSTPWLGLSLSAFTWSLCLQCDDKMYEIGREALSIHLRLLEYSSTFLHAYLYTLRVLTYSHFDQGHMVDALRCSNEALLVIYHGLAHLATTSEDSLISWKVHWSGHAVLHAPLTLMRDPWVTQSAGFFLTWTAYALSALGRYREAWVAGLDAMHVLKAFQARGNTLPPYLQPLTHYTSDLAKEIIVWDDMSTSMDEDVVVFVQEMNTC